MRSGLGELTSDQPLMEIIWRSAWNLGQVSLRGHHRIDVLLAAGDSSIRPASLRHSTWAGGLAVCRSTAATATATAGSQRQQEDRCVRPGGASSPVCIAALSAGTPSA